MRMLIDYAEAFQILDRPWPSRSFAVGCKPGYIDQKWRPYIPQSLLPKGNKTASFQKEAMRTQVALWFFYEVKFV